MIPREKIERVLGIMRKEFRQVFRDERMSRLLFISPSSSCWCSATRSRPTCAT